MQSYKLPLLLGLMTTLISVTIANSPGNSWVEYTNRYNKIYNSKLDEAKHRAIFEAKKIWIKKINARELDYRLELNMYSDWTLKQLKEQLLGYIADQEVVSDPSAKAFLDAILESSVPIPDRLDWRSVSNRVSAVKSQGRCGSSWAFSAIGTLEGQLYNYGFDKLVELSVQQLVDCTKMNQACDGGSLWAAFKGIKDYGGVKANSSYPYVGRETRCIANKNDTLIKLLGSALLNNASEQDLKKLVALYGPVPVAIHAGPLLFSYQQGIVDNTDCDSIKTANHAVLVVGYDSDSDGDYWIMKNSWGSSWGEDGYLRMRRLPRNKCGISNSVIIPVLMPDGKIL